MEPVCCLVLFSNGCLAELVQPHRLCNVHFEDERVLESRKMGKEEGVAYFEI
jgi:hypothetical protein